MNRKNIALFFVLTNFFIFSQDLPKVTLSKLKSIDNYDIFYYGARIEPNLVYKQYAPISGVVTDIFKDVGNYVKKDQNILTVTRKQSGGVIYNPTFVKAISDGIITSMNLFTGLEVIEKQELFSIAQITSYKVNLLVSDRDIPFIKIGNSCTIKGAQNLAGKITQVAVVPSPTTGLFEVEITFPNYKELFIGKYVEIELKVNQVRGITIAQNLITRKYGKTFLFILNGDTVEMREVKLGRVYSSNVIIESGVKEGEEFVVTANKTLNDGDVVEINRGDKKGNRENSQNR